MCWQNCRARRLFKQVEAHPRPSEPAELLFRQACSTPHSTTRGGGDYEERRCSAKLLPYDLLTSDFGIRVSKSSLSGE